MLSWRDRGRGGNNLDGTPTASGTEGDVSLPLGPGEWEEGLGLPLCVVCQNVSWFHDWMIIGVLMWYLVRSHREPGKGAVVEGRRIRLYSAVSTDDLIETYVHSTELVDWLNTNAQQTAHHLYTQFHLSQVLYKVSYTHL
jgi:hypothetical protein